MPSQFIAISRPDELVDRVGDWIEFANRVGLVAPFCGAEAWIAWLEGYAGQDLRVFELRQEGRLKALLPMFRKGMGLHMACESILDYQEVAAESLDDAVELITRVIECEGAKGFSLTFAQVAESSLLDAALKDERIARLASLQSRYQSLCSTVTFPVRGQNGVLGSFSGQQRRDYKVATKQIGTAFPGFSVEHLLGVEVTKASLEAVARVHRDNQFRKAGPSVFDEANFVPFLLRQVELGAPLSLSLLRENPGGEVIAFNLGYFSRDTFFYYLTSYEARHAALSPGRWILADSIRHLSGKVAGDSLRLDLLSGEEAYKKRWAKSYYKVTRYQVIPWRFPNLPRVAAYSALYGVKAVKNRLLDRLRTDRLNDLEHETTSLFR